MRIANWGNYPQIDATLVDIASAESALMQFQRFPQAAIRGLGRCYGDSALNDVIFSTCAMNQIRAFDAEHGTITCEAGTSLDAILQYGVPQGWFLPVTPGTKFVTLGGAIAADVHGKNHHGSGSFSTAVHAITVMLADGSIQTCSKTQNSDLFWATCGGMGLTGLILEATIQLIPIETAYIRQTSIKAANLDEILALFEEHRHTPYSVAWIDCLAKGEAMGRSILLCGDHAQTADLLDTLRKKPLALPRTLHIDVPFTIPFSLVNDAFVRSFNQLYFAKQCQRHQETLMHYDAFFYPLDRIHHWNRIYGPRGFTQYQFVLPKAASYEGLKRILGEISAQKLGSFLAVLKLLGPQTGMVSFPQEGYTLTLDFPITPGLFPLLDRLDELVLHYGGRLYLAKDVRMSQAFFEATYPNSRAFKALKQQLDPGGRFQSLQSKRIGL